MTIKERHKDIMKTGLFNSEELVEDMAGVDSFKSWEYYTVLHFTNEEFYYLSDEETDNFNTGSDLKKNTPKGIIFCYS